MRQFWQHGFASSSINDPVRVTGVSRYGLYGEFGDSCLGKRDLIRNVPSG